MSLSQIKYLIVGLIILLGTYTIYNKVYSRGYLAAEAKYTLVINEYKEKQQKSINDIETNIRAIIDSSEKYNTSLSLDLANIKSGIKKAPIVVYKDGKCTLAKEFLDSRENAITRANQR